MNFDHSLWGLVVPDGSRFCHWGGKRLSKKLAERLDVSVEDSVLDLCCGEGGITDFLHGTGKIVGIDISEEAILQARASSVNSKAAFIAGDARKLPFPAQAFDKVIAQDADVWMHPDKAGLMREIARVTKPGGTFLWQSYVTREKTISSKTARLLEQVGYTVHDMPEKSQIARMFLENGFAISSVESLHSIYARDNEHMLYRAQSIQAPHQLTELLEWERELFRKNLWTGVLVEGTRNPA